MDRRLLRDGLRRTGARRGSLATGSGAAFFLVGLTVFAVGSIGAAFSGSVDLLIAWRAVMGAGAALTIPSSLSIINDVFREPAQRAKAIGAWAATIGLGIAIGPIAGGLLLARFSWGSIFLVNVPIVIAAFTGAMVLLRLKEPGRRSSRSRRRSALDRRLGLAALGDHRRPDQRLEVRERRRGRSPQRCRAARLCRLGSQLRPPDAEAGLLSRSEVFGRRGGRVPRRVRVVGGPVRRDPVPTVRPRLLTAPGGPADPADRGHARFAAASASITARLIGIKFTAAAALLAIAGGLWQISAASTVSATYGDVLPGLLLIGVGAGLPLPTATNSVVGSVPQADSGIGSAANTVALQVGGALGVAVIGSAMLTRYQIQLPRRSRADTYQSRRRTQS